MKQPGNIIELAPFVEDNRYPDLREVEAYWQALRAGRLVPRRSELDPRGIERALEFAFIVERIAPGIARLRIAGSHLSDLMGMEVRGMPLTSFFTTSGRDLMGDVLEQVFDAPARAELRLAAERGIGKPAIDARLLLLPMKSDLGDISRALGCLSTQGVIGRAPRRFEIVDHDIRALRAEGLAAPDDAVEVQPQIGFAEPPRPFEAAADDRVVPFPKRPNPTGK